MSSPNRIAFTCIDITPDNKVLEQDSDGYYLITLGAFNCFNQSGDFYSLDGVKEYIENTSGSFVRRISAGYLKGEAGHPVFQPGMTPTQFYARNMRIEITNVSHHIKSVYLETTNTPSGVRNKGNVVLVKGWVRPTGAMGDGLKKDLDDPNCNVSFSIRCITNNVSIGGVMTKTLDSIITWDWVIEPGIKAANKFDTLKKSLGISMESRDIRELDIKSIIYGNELSELISSNNFSLEDNSLMLDITNELKSKYKTNGAIKSIRNW